MSKNETITVTTIINSTIEQVWKSWITPEHIVNWNFATNEWCCPSALNDLRPKGEFNWRMEAKDGSIGFNFTGTYTQVKEKELITYTMSDGRTVSISFSIEGNGIRLTETFEAEGTNSDEQQRAGWQAILENFKRYVESME